MPDQGIPPPSDPFGDPDESTSPAGSIFGDLDPTDEEIAAARRARERRRTDRSTSTDERARALRTPRAATADDDVAGSDHEDGSADGDPDAESAPRRRGAVRNIVEWVVVIGVALGFALLIRMFLFQTFWIPSGSMADTLVRNDRVMVNKLAYRWGSPSRGDVIVFERVPGDPGTIKDLIKRVVALPGERVSIINGSVWIDGRELIEPYTDGAPTDLQCGTGNVPGIDTPDGFQVPDGHVFVLGDNRTASHDGRCFGPIPEDLIVGRALAVIWPPSKIGRL